MKREDCIFCKVANGSLASSTIYEDGDFRVILDLHPASKGHALILSKEHYGDICDLDEQIAQKVLSLAARTGKAMKRGLGCGGFNIVQNNGAAAGQTIPHFHVHVIPRDESDRKLLTWDPLTMEIEEQKEIAEKIKAAL